MSCVADCGDASISVMDYDDDTIDDINTGINKINLINLNKCNDDAPTNVLLYAPPTYRGSNYANFSIKCKSWINKAFMLNSTTLVKTTNVNPNASNNH